MESEDKISKLGKKMKGSKKIIAMVMDLVSAEAYGSGAAGLIPPPPPLMIVPPPSPVPNLAEGSSGVNQFKASMSVVMQDIASSNFKLNKTKIEAKPKEVKVSEKDKSLIDQILSQGKKLVSSRLMRTKKADNLSHNAQSPKVGEDAIKKQIEVEGEIAKQIEVEVEIAKQIEVEVEIAKQIEVEVEIAKQIEVEVAIAKQIEVEVAIAKQIEVEGEIAKQMIEPAENYSLQEEVIREESVETTRSASIGDTRNELVGNGLNINLDETEDEAKAEEKENNNILADKARVTAGFRRAGAELEAIVENILSTRTAQIDAAMQMINMPHHIIKNRLFNLGNYMPLVAVTAGSEDSNVSSGVWGSGGFAISKQNERVGLAHYKGKQVVATIGVDAEISDGNIVGLAYSNVRSILSFDERCGKSQINSHILSLYSQHNLAPDLTLQLMGSLSGSKIKNKINIKKKGKSYARSSGVEGDISYRYVFRSGMQLISTIGVKYHYIRVGLYKEQSANSSYMLKVLGRVETTLTGLIGSKLIFKEIALGESLKLVPSMQGGFEKSFAASKKVVVDTIASINRSAGKVRVEMPRTLKQGYNLGAGITLVSNSTKLELDYNCHIQKAYRSHEGILKLKVNL